MSTYEQIKQLRGKENNNLIKVLRYIADKEKYMSCGNVQYTKLYYGFLKNKFIQVAQRYPNRNISISIRQYKRLKKYSCGKFPINTFVYLLALYEIMLSYQKKANLTPNIDDITYTTYIIGLLKDQIGIVLNLHHFVSDYFNQEKYDIYNAIYEDFVNLDNITANNNLKLYNNIW